MSVAIDLVVTHLDGTLWHPGEGTHPEAAAAIRRVAVAVLAAFRATGVDPVVYVDPDAEGGPDVGLSDTPSTHPEHVAHLADASAVGDLGVIAATATVLSLGVLGLPSGVAVAVRDRIGDAATTSWSSASAGKRTRRPAYAMTSR
jgi:hypothetical protein